jgi:hypothetical protein
MRLARCWVRAAAELGFGEGAPIRLSIFMGWDRNRAPESISIIVLDRGYLAKLISAIASLAMSIFVCLQ